jgi:hypothetical protein
MALASLCPRLLLIDLTRMRTDREYFVFSRPWCRLSGK